MDKEIFIEPGHVLSNTSKASSREESFENCLKGSKYSTQNRKKQEIHGAVKKQNNNTQKGSRQFT